MMAALATALTLALLLAGVRVLAPALSVVKVLAALALQGVLGVVLALTAVKVQRLAEKMVAGISPARGLEQWQGWGLDQPPPAS